MKMYLSVLVLVGLLVAPAASSAVKGIAQERVEEQRVKGDSGRQLQPADHSQRAQQQQQHYEQRVQVAYPAKGQPEAYPSEQAKLAESDLYQQREEVKGDRQQFYEAQPQLRESADSKQDSSRRSAVQSHATKVEERIEEQAKYEDYPQQREEAPAPPVKGTAKLDYRPEVTRTQQEAKQVREEVAAPAAPVLQAKGSAKVEQAPVSKIEEQVQYTAQAPEEQRYEAQRTFDQAELQQQQVELNRDYEQRRYEEPTEQRQSFSGQVREEQLVKGGLRAPGAEAEPYAFDYSVEGSSRRESGDQNGVVRGQYTLQNPDGTQRVVDYVADQDGFRAQVRTNEFGTEGHQQAQVAAAAVRAAPLLEGKTHQQQQEVARVAVVAAAPQASIKTIERTKQSIYQEEKSASGTFKVEAAKGAAEARTAPVAVHEPEPAVQRAAPAVETIKSAELRSPKAIGYRSGPIVTRASGFESATAHHQHLAPVVHSHPVPVPVVAVRHQPVPAVPVVRHQVLTPVRSHHHHLSGYQQSGLRHTHPLLVQGGVSRSQLQHDRYPPASYRREHQANPHVSFYAHHNHEDEQPIGFEHPADLV